MERAPEEHPVDRSGDRPPVAGGGGQREEAHPVEACGERRRVEALFGGVNFAEVRAGTGVARIDHLLQCREVVGSFVHVDSCHFYAVEEFELYTVDMPVQRGTLTIDQIVDAATDLIDEDGLAKLSMRRLGARLGVDPMALYHHVDNKQALLARVLQRATADLPRADPDAPWADEVRRWAIAWWRIVVRHRDLVAASLVDPVIAAGGIPAAEPLADAVHRSGLDPEAATAAVYLVVDFVHGSALSGGLDRADDRATELQAHFERGLDIVIAGIAATTRLR